MPDLGTLVDRYLEDRWQRDPVAATSVGIHRYDHLLGDYRPSAVEEGYRKKQEFLAEFRSLDVARLTPLERLDWQLALSELETEVETHRLRLWERSPAMYADAAVTGVYLLIARAFAPLRQRLDAVRARLEAFPSFFEVARSNLTAATPPVFVEIGLQMAGGGQEFLGSAIPPLAADLGREDVTASKLLLEATRRAEDALRDYVAFLEGHRTRAHGDFAVGREMFDFLLRRQHLLDLDSDSLRALGQRYFSAVEAELESLAAQISPGKPWPEQVEELRRNHPAADDLLAAYRAEMERARQFTIERELATLAPDEVLEVVDTPSFLRGIMPYAAYDPPPAFGPDMKGLFYVTPVSAETSPDLREQQLEGHSYYVLPVIALHEGYPGHHLQLSRAKLIDSPLRCSAQSSLFAEGWALYCEEMMHEVGFYPDLRVRLFQLKDTLWRAARVLVDVGLHTGGMSFQQAVDFMVERVKLERPHAEAEVRRYTMTPTQPMSYLVGKHLILELRRQCQARQGGDFNLRDFHDQLLSYGTIPTPLVVEQMLRR